MTAPRWTLCVIALASLLRAGPVMAQSRTPQIGYVYPAGGQAGTTFEITVGGQALEGVDGVEISGRGVRGTVLNYVKPINQGKAGELRDRLMELRKITPVDPAAAAEMASIVRTLILFAKRSQAPAMAETVEIRVTVDADALLSPGPRQLRLCAPGGRSNPRLFCIDQLPEVAERAATSLPESITLRDLRELEAFRYRQVPTAATPIERAITLPAVLNGQILPGGVIRYRFTASKGARLVASADARRLVPYVADAVPGWFQAVLTLYDPRGREIASADHFQARAESDPMLFHELPSDGEYVLEIRDTLFRGREDFVYRIRIGELPLVTDVFPLGGPVGRQTPVTCAGWNLIGPSAGPLVLDGRDKAPGVYWLNVCPGAPPVAYAIDAPDIPEQLEREPNNSAASAHAVSAPVIVNGRIDSSGDRDVFRVDGRPGQWLTAEVVARRLGSPLDSILKVTDAAGRVVATNDDCPDKGDGLRTHHADSRVSFAVPPGGGPCLVHLGDVQRAGGRAYAYRLRISQSRPDFELRIAPSTVTLRKWTHTPVTVCAIRRDGFDGTIDLSLASPGGNVVMLGGVIPAGQDQVRITLAPVATGPTTQPTLLPLDITGRATIAGNVVARRAVPVEDMMQAFAYRHLVPTDRLAALVRPHGGGRWNPAAGFDEMVRIRMAAGGTASFATNMPLQSPTGRVDFELNDPPEGIRIVETVADGDGSRVVLKADGVKARPPLAGNLIVDVYATPNPPAARVRLGTQPSTQPAPPPRRPQRRQIGTLPAIRFEIVP